MKKIINFCHPAEETNGKIDNSITRRKFICNAALATAGISLIPNGCIGNGSRWRYGCYTRPWGQYDYRVAFDGIAEAGFKYAALMTVKGGLVITRDTEPEEAFMIGEEAKSRGLQIAEMYGGNHDARQSIDDGIIQLKRLIDNADSCGSPTLMLGGIGAPELVDVYYKVIAECCDYALEKGITMAIKQHGGTNTTGAQCRQHIEKVGHKNFKLLYDPGNVYFYTDGKLDPVDDAEDVDGLVVGLCVKDFRLPKNVNVTPGTGMVNFPKLLARLKEGGFTKGSMMVETLDNRGDNSYIINEAKKSLLFLEELTS